MQIKTAMSTTSHLLEWLLSVAQEITSVGEVVEKRDPCTLLVGAASMENSIEVP